MQDEHERTARLSASGREMHRRTARNNDMGAPRSPDHLVLRGFQTRFSGQCVPSLRARMPMCGCRHTWCENCLHVLR